MVTGAVHHYLIAEGIRTDANLIIETGLARDSHQIAVLIGFGATCVYPYLAYDVIDDLVATGELLGDPIQARVNFRKGLDKGLLKILSKWVFLPLFLIAVPSYLKQLVCLSLWLICALKAFKVVLKAQPLLIWLLIKHN